MPIYSFSAIETQSNKVIEGKLEAENFRQAKELLREDGKIPTRLDEEAEALDFGQMFQKIPIIGQILKPKVSMAQTSIMTQQLSTLIDAGIPLIESIYLLEQQTPCKRMKEILKNVRANVIAGDSFSRALSRYDKDFTPLYINMIKAGEVSGDLDKICFRLSMLLEKYIALQKKMQSAMVYPGVTLAVIIGVVVIVLWAVVPTFKGLFGHYDQELPAPTVMLMSLSDFFVAFWWVIIPSFLLGVGWLVTFCRGPGKPLFDQWILTVPVLGMVFRKIYVSRFIRTLATVTASGVSLVAGLETSTETVDNYVLREALTTAKDSVLMGGGLARPLELTNAFPLMVVKMVAIGEETGKMEQMLNKSADFLDAEVDHAVTNLTTLIEPLMIVIMGSILLFVALAMYLPMFEMAGMVSG